MTALSGMADMLTRCRDAFGRSVTVRRVTAGALNAATGVRATTTLAETITAIQGQREMQVDGGVPAVETTYQLVAADLSFEPSVGDEVVDGAATRRVYKLERSVDGKAITLFCRETAQ